MDEKLAEIYGNKVRVRACGLCWNGDKLLMANHDLVMPTHFWAPPGGGVDFGRSIEEVLKKEFAEETGLTIIPEKFLFGCEFIQAPLHSIELFYSVTVKSGNVKTGFDPEIQIIKDVCFLSPKEIGMIPENELHGIFRLVDNPSDLMHLSGFFRI